MDFNAIAKGYMVDVIGSHLTQVGYANFLIEIGGELLASGSNPKTMQAWKVAIDDPQQGIERTLKTVLPQKRSFEYLELPQVPHRFFDREKASTASILIHFRYNPRFLVPRYELPIA